jgi:hypothetical protein
MASPAVSSPSTPSVESALRPRDLSANPILNVGGTMLSRPPSVNRLRPATPLLSSREQQRALIWPAPTTGEVRALEQSVSFTFTSMEDAIRAHDDMIRTLETKARAAAAVESRVFELSAEMRCKADASALDRQGARTDEALERLRGEMDERARQAARVVEREIQSQLAELQRRAATAEAALSDESAARKLADADARRTADALQRLEARVAATEATSGALRRELEHLRVAKPEKADLHRAVHEAADELTLNFEKGLAAARADAAACREQAREAAALVGSAEARTVASERALADARAHAAAELADAERRWRARVDAIELALADAVRQDVARAERSDALERRVAMRTEGELRKARETAAADTAAAAAAAAAALERAEGAWRHASEIQTAQLRAAIEERAGCIERAAAAAAGAEALAAADALARVERALRAALAAKADSASVSSAIADCARTSQLRELALAVAEASAEARGAKAALREAFSTASPLEARLASLEASLATKCALADAHALADARPDFAQLDDALQTIDRSLAAAASAVEVAALAAELQRVAELARAEHALARWVWDSGQAAGADGRVLWDAQPTNLLPANFQWARGSAEIGVSAAGLYEFKFGLFGSGRARARLLVDDEVVAEAVAGAPSGRGQPAARELDTERVALSPLGALNRDAGITRAGRADTVRRKGRQGRATIVPPPRALLAPSAPLGAWDEMATSHGLGPRLSGPTCMALVCLLPNARVSLALGPDADWGGGLNGFLEVRKVFN